MTPTATLAWAGFIGLVSFSGNASSGGTEFWVLNIDFAVPA